MVLSSHWELSNACRLANAWLGLSDAQVGLAFYWCQVVYDLAFGIEFMHWYLIFVVIVF